MRATRSVEWAFALIAMTSLPALAAERDDAGCRNVALISNPSFKGLEKRVIAAGDAQWKWSSEGGEFKAYFRGTTPVYVVADLFGETGKMTSVIQLQGGSARSYSARVTDTRYAEPIGVAPTKIVSIRTTSFSVCNGSLVQGAGGATEDEKALAVQTTELVDGLLATGKRKASGATN